MKPSVTYGRSNEMVAYLFLLCKIMVILWNLCGAFNLCLETSWSKGFFDYLLHGLSEKVVHGMSLNSRSTKRPRECCLLLRWKTRLTDHQLVLSIERRTFHQMSLLATSWPLEVVCYEFLPQIVHVRQIFFISLLLLTLQSM